MTREWQQGHALALSFTTLAERNDKLGSRIHRGGRQGERDCKHELPSTTNGLTIDSGENLLEGQSNRPTVNKTNVPRAMPSAPAGAPWSPWAKGSQNSLLSVSLWKFCSLCHQSPSLEPLPKLHLNSNQKPKINLTFLPSMCNCIYLGHFLFLHFFS